VIRQRVFISTTSFRIDGLDTFTSHDLRRIFRVADLDVWPNVIDRAEAVFADSFGEGCTDPRIEERLQAALSEIDRAMNLIYSIEHILRTVPIPQEVQMLIEFSAR
jgi:hypothetical protein